MSHEAGSDSGECKSRQWPFPEGPGIVQHRAAQPAGHRTTEGEPDPDAQATQQQKQEDTGPRSECRVGPCHKNGAECLVKPLPIHLVPKSSKGAPIRVFYQKGCLPGRRPFLGDGSAKGFMIQHHRKVQGSLVDPPLGHPVHHRAIGAVDVSAQKQ
jgi:hypothetical protein